LYLVDHLLDAPGHGRFARVLLKPPGAFDIAEALGNEIDERGVDPVDLGTDLVHVRALGGALRVCHVICLPASFQHRPAPSLRLATIAPAPRSGRPPARSPRRPRTACLRRMACR